MASASQSVVVRPVSGVLGRGGLVDRYFYFFLSLVAAGVVVAGFGRTVDHFLIHATPPRPMLLWIHGAAFSAWVVLFIVQSALVRVRNQTVTELFGQMEIVAGATSELLTIRDYAIARVLERCACALAKALR